MARVIDAKYSTLIGTPSDLRKLLDVLAAGASVVDLKHSRIVVLDQPPDRQALIAPATDERRT